MLEINNTLRYRRYGRKGLIMKLINEKIFKAFLDDNLDAVNGVYDYAACLADLDRAIGDRGIDGRGTYELSPYETKSRHPETICIRVERDEDNEYIVKF